MRANAVKCWLGLLLLSVLLGCVQQDGQSSFAPVIVSLNTEASVMLGRVYDEPLLTQSLAAYGLPREQIEAEVLKTCSIAYSIVARTENKPKERARQLKELHGSAYYIAEENRCVETLIASKVEAQQWQRIKSGQFDMGEIVHLARFDTALTQFNDWALQACPAKHTYVATVFTAIEQRIMRQQADMQLLKQHYQDAKRLARVLSWHSGRRAEDYHSSLERAREFSLKCRANAVPNYRGISLQ